jgi:large subunit ribosomal protein L24e
MTLFLPRTIFYRRLRKKGTQEDALKKAKKRAIQSSVMARGIAGISIEDLKAKKAESGDKRKAMRDATVREAKDAKRKAQDQKKKEKKAAPAGAAAQNVKMGKAGGAAMKPARSSAPGKQAAR